MKQSSAPLPRGLGWACCPKFAVTPDVAAGFIKVLNVKHWNCVRPLSVFYRDGKHLSAAQRAFLEFLRTDEGDIDRQKHGLKSMYGIDEGGVRSP